MSNKALNGILSGLFLFVASQAMAASTTNCGDHAYLDKDQKCVCEYGHNKLAGSNTCTERTELRGRKVNTCSEHAYLDQDHACVCEYGFKWNAVSYKCE